MLKAMHECEANNVYKYAKLSMVTACVKQIHEGKT